MKSSPLKNGGKILNLKKPICTNVINIGIEAHKNLVLKADRFEEVLNQALICVLSSM